MLEAFKNVQQSSSKDILECLAKFICWGYIKKKKDRCTITTLPAARCYMCKQEKVKSDKIPPTWGAFVKHCARASYTLKQFSYKATINIGDPLNDDDEYVPHTSDDDIAPTEIIDLTSFKCKTNCRCFAINFDCTDVCGYTDICENTDPSTPAIVIQVYTETEEETVYLFIYIFFINYFL